MTRSGLSYHRNFGTMGPRSPLGSLEQQYEIPEAIDQLNQETMKRNKLYSALALAKRNNDKFMTAKIEKELGIREDENEATQTEDTKAFLEVLRMKILDPNVANEDKEIALRAMASINVGKGGGNMAYQAYMAPAKPAEVKKDDMADLTKTLITSLIENKTKESNESDMDKFIKYQKFLNENTPDPMAVFKDAQDTLKVMGVDISGSKSMQELQMGLEKLKLEKEFAFKDKELDAKQEQNKMMGGWIKELSSAVVEGIVDSIDDDDEKDDTDTKSNKKGKSKEIPREMRVRCFNCRKQFKISDPSETREVICENCSWPHFFTSGTNQVQSITGDSVRQSLKMEPEEWLKNYKTGQLEEMLNEPENEKSD